MDTEEGSDTLLHATGVADEEAESFPSFPVLCHVGDFVKGEDVGYVHKHTAVNI